MKSVTNSKRSPFHVNKNGHDDGLRSSSSTVTDEESGADGEPVSAWSTPEGHRTRTTSATDRGPRPNNRSLAATAGVALDDSRRWLKLPARICTLDPTPDALLPRPRSRTRSELFRMSPLLCQNTGPLEPSVTKSTMPSPSRSAAARPRGDTGAAAGVAPAIAFAVTSDHWR